MTIKELLQKTEQLLKSAEISNSHLEGRWMIEDLLQVPEGCLSGIESDAVADEKVTQLTAWVKRRKHGEPLAYILGHKEFYKYDFKVSAKVLIPRPETELLVEEAVQWAQSENLYQPNIVEFGIGSGCLGISIVKELCTATLYGCDISSAAVEMSQQNSKDLGVQGRSRFMVGDAGAIVPTRLGIRDHGADIVVMNPPYIDRADKNVQQSVTNFEPHLALFAKDEGLALVKQWVRHALASFCSSTSLLLCEFGASQGQQVASWMSEEHNDLNWSIKQDYSGFDRYLRIELNE